jgi:hypothetical protein
MVKKDLNRLPTHRASLCTLLVFLLWPRVQFLVTLYFYGVLDNFLLKNTIGLLS